jgi:ribonuclease III
MKLISNIFKKSRSIEDGIFFDNMKEILGFDPGQLEIYRRAFSHKSLNKTDSQGNVYSYERLEFLGDSVIGTVIASYLYNQVPAGDEGYLTKMRSKIVSRSHLNELGKELNLVQLIDKKASAQNLSENVHGNVFEALVGAVFLDKGYAYCEKFIYKRVIRPHVDIKRLEGKIISYKSLLIEWCQKEKKSFRFDVKTINENSRDISFEVRLYIEDELLSKAGALSKKAAEEKAATRGYYALQNKMSK